MIGNDESADIIASKVRVHYTGAPLIIRQVVFKAKTRESLLEQITTASLVSGYIELPRDMLLEFPAKDLKQINFQTMSQKGNRLQMHFACKTELEKLGLNEQFILLQKKDKTDLSKLRLKKKSIIKQVNRLRNEDDGLTELGRKLYGDPNKIAEREAKILDLKSQLSDVDLSLQSIAMRAKEHEFLFTGEVQVRE